MTVEQQETAAETVCECEKRTASSESIHLLRELVQRESLTPEDAGCQALLGERLAALGFNLERLPAGGVSNLWARLGEAAPLFVFAGHTDVVPAGDPQEWTSPPFDARIVDEHLVGRGAADMKGGLAAMMTAMERFIGDGGLKRGSLALLLTSDEEGVATHGTRHVIEVLDSRGEKIDYCIVGEPSSDRQLGDTIRHGRRGSLSARLVIRGTQGHVAYPQLADNPIHRAMPALAELSTIEWDRGDEYFPATTLQISNIQAGTGAVNMIPGQLSVDFNLRFGPQTRVEAVQTRVRALCERHGLDAELNWSHSADPFITSPAELTDALQRAIAESCTEVRTTLDTGGGTSDGRFIAPTGAQVVEFGPINATIHQVDERVSCSDIDTLSRIYESVLHQLLG